MAVTDPRVDAYIDKSAAFAQPILTHLRQLVHKACPDAVETIKWGMPFFQHNGGLLCHIAAFKQHCVLGLWKHAPLLKDPEGVLKVKDKDGMGHFDRITSVKDLPPARVITGLLKEAIALIDAGPAAPASPAKKAAPKPPLTTPPELTAALKKNAKAQRTFEGFPPSHRKEYIQWITEAKTDATREKRIATTIGWLEEGKSRNWKYK